MWLLTAYGMPIIACLSQEVFHTEGLENCNFDNYHIFLKLMNCFASFRHSLASSLVLVAGCNIEVRWGM